MSVLRCDRYGSVDCVGGVCKLCNGCGDEDPPRCPDGVVHVTEPYSSSNGLPNTLGRFARKQCPLCEAAMLNWPGTFEWRCACGAVWNNADGLIIHGDVIGHHPPSLVTNETAFPPPAVATGTEEPPWPTEPETKEAA